MHHKHTISKAQLHSFLRRVQFPSTRHS